MTDVLDGSLSLGEAVSMDRVHLGLEVLYKEKKHCEIPCKYLEKTVTKSGILITKKKSHKILEGLVFTI